MKIQNRLKLPGLGLVRIMAAIFFPFAAGGAVGIVNTLVVLPESTIELQGDSTLKKFSSKATQINIQATFPGTSGTFLNPLGGDLEQFIVTMPVAGLKSGDGTLDEHLSEALHGEKYPEIRVAIKNYQVKEKRPDGALLVTAGADFTIAGVTKSLPLEAIVTLQGDRLRVKGERQFLMTDFKIEPPSLLIGIVKTRNEIDVKYEVVFSIKPSVNEESVK